MKVTKNKSKEDFQIVRAMPEGDPGSNVDLSTGPVVARASSGISLLLIHQIRLILTDYSGL